MPLTSFSRVQKTFPSIFARDVSDHVKQRADAYRNYRPKLPDRTHITKNGLPPTKPAAPDDMVLEYLEDEEISEMCDSDGEVSSNSLGHSQSRLTPEMHMLRTRNLTNGLSGSESETSSATTTPRAKSSPSPRMGGFPVQLLESPHLQANGFIPAFTVSPRKPRQSPRTTCSLDNVDLWEEEEASDVDGSSTEVTTSTTTSTKEQQRFDCINGVAINPSKTFDLSDLRRSRSPVACKRNRLMPGDSDQRESNRAKSRSGSREKKKNVMSRARMVRRHNKHMLPNATLKAKPTLKEQHSIITEEDSSKSSSKHSADTVNDTSNQRLLPQRLPRLAAKFPTKIPVHRGMFSSKKDISKMVKDNGTSKTSVGKEAYNQSTNGGDKVKIMQTVSSKLPFPLIEESSGVQCETVSQKDDSKGKDRTKNGETENINNGIKVPKPPSYGAPPSRKVKFNSFVTVREDELNTLDYLKHSNDSAKLFKNKYLRGNTDLGTCSQEGQESDLMIQTIG